MELNDIVSLTVVISFAAAVIQYIIIRPLQMSIATLGEAVTELRQLLQDINCRLNTETRNLDIADRLCRGKRKVSTQKN